MKFRFSLNSDLAYLPAAVTHPFENRNQHFTRRHQRSISLMRGDTVDNLVYGVSCFSQTSQCSHAIIFNPDR